MNGITTIENAVLTAIDNEALGCTKEQRIGFEPEARAWENATIYAEMYGFTTEEFRHQMRKMGWDFPEA